MRLERPETVFPPKCMGMKNVHRLSQSYPGLTSTSSIVCYKLAGMRLWWRGKWKKPALPWSPRWDYSDLHKKLCKSNCLGGTAKPGWCYRISAHLLSQIFASTHSVTLLADIYTHPIHHPEPPGMPLFLIFSGRDGYSVGRHQMLPAVCAGSPAHTLLGLLC